ncbi:substrate-binding domain-containing protein [Labilibacter sediminis]|nr:substrate-binding domain-containing protein [Labilibacter sediminis]
MKKLSGIYWLVFFAFVLLTVSGCKEEKKMTIGFLYPSDLTERYNKESSYFEAYAAKHDVDVIIKTASYDESLQIEIARELIEKEIDAMVIIAVNVNTAAVIVREAHNEDIPVMAYNRMITNSDVDFFVACDNDLIGKIMVDGALKKSPSGNYVILGGHKFDKNGEELQKAVKKYLKPSVESGSVNIVYETFIEQWTPAIAAFELEKVISLYGTDIDAAIVGYDGMANAVIEVLEKYDLEGKVAVTGQDAEVIGCKNIIAGKQAVTVFHPLKTLAEKAAEISIEMAKGKNTKEFVNSSEFNGQVDVPTHRVNSIAVDKDNIDEVLIKSGFYKREDIY